MASVKIYTLNSYENIEKTLNEEVCLVIVVDELNTLARLQ